MEENNPRSILPKEIREQYESILQRFKDPVRLSSFNNFIKYIETRTSYLIAPASTKYHLSCPHGLLIHSISVTSIMLNDKESKWYYKDIPEESIIVAGMFHDLGKAGLSLEDPYYIECEATAKQKEFGYGPSQPYKVNVPENYSQIKSGTLEHAHSSALMVAKFYSAATYDELFAILIHDGVEKDSNKDYVFKENKLHTLLHHADVESSKWAE